MTDMPFGYKWNRKLEENTTTEKTHYFIEHLETAPDLKQQN